MPVDEVLVRRDEEGARPARRVDNADPGDVRGPCPPQQRPERRLDDVVHDRRRRVVDPACLPHLGLHLDRRRPAGEGDGGAEELLVDPAEDVCRHHRELVRVRVVQPLHDSAEDMVGHVERQAEGVRRPELIGRPGEVEQPGVVPIVGTLEDAGEPVVDAWVLLVDAGLQLAELLDAAGLGDPQEDDPVDQGLDAVVQGDDAEVGFCLAMSAARAPRHALISSRKAWSTGSVPRDSALSAESRDRDPAATASRPNRPRGRPTARPARRSRSNGSGRSSAGRTGAARHGSRRQPTPRSR